MDYILEAQGLQIELNKNPIIHDVSLGIRANEILTIIGPNGSGKSTLIKGLCRLLKPRAGRVLLRGKDIFSVRSGEVARTIAVLPQKKSLPADITVERLVQYGRVPYAKFGGRLDGEDLRMIEEMLALTGTDRFRFRKVSTLSGGESQMAWIAMALAQQPQILFLDEPTTFLDISYQMAVLELVKQIHAAKGISVVMVLHDLNQAALYSQRLAVIQDGRLVAEGSPEDLYQEEMFRNIFHVETEKVCYSGGEKHYYIPLRMASEKEEEHASS